MEGNVKVLCRALQSVSLLERFPEAILESEEPSVTIVTIHSYNLEDKSTLLKGSMWPTHGFQTHIHTC